MIAHRRTEAQRGTVLVVILFVATAIAALAAISSGRVVTHARHQNVLEDEARAYNNALARIHLAVNVVDNSGYDDENQNLELQAAIAGTHGGTAGGDDPADEPWLQDPTGVLHGKIRGTDVRVYRGRDYVKRLAKLKGENVPASVDPADQSRRFFVMESVGRSGDVVRVLSALVRENQPFSSFVFFQNRHPLGVSGAPRGLIHSNDRIDFYFANGNYVDSVTAVRGFDYKAGANESNTNLEDGNPAATEISLEEVDFTELRGKADLFEGSSGLDAEIRFHPDGRVEIQEYTPPRFDMVEREYSETYVAGYEEEEYTRTEQVQVGTTTEERTRQVQVGTTTETYTVEIPIYEDEEYTVMVPVYEDREVTRTRQVPVHETQTVTRTRWVRVFVPYDDGDGSGGGTAVGGDGSGQAGEYVWVEEEYEAEEQVVVGYEDEEYTVVESVQVGEREEERTRQVQVGSTTEERTREVPVYADETYTVEVPVYEEQEVEDTRLVPVYDTNTWSEWEREFQPPVHVGTTWTDLSNGGGTIYVDGRITRLSGEVNGRATIVGNEKVRITGDLRYVDDQGRHAMVNGSDYSQPYARNPDYQGHSTLGIIARDDVLFTRDMPAAAEINATLMSTTGRVGVDGFAIEEDGDPTKDQESQMTEAEREKEEAYDRTSYRSDDFVKESLRRIGGIISNDRILETYIRPRGDGTTFVDAGFKRGSMRFDFNLLFNPPPNFVEVPRPVVTYYTPVFFMRGEDA